jgi:hypothetical protein
MIRNISAAFAGGAVGGFVDSFNIWFMGKVGVSNLIGLSMKPESTAPWLYQRMIWGCIWMLLLLFPLMRDKVLLRGCFFSFLQSAMMLFLVLPGMGKGVLGIGFGAVTPMIVIGLNCIYGMVASLLYRESTA